MDYVGNSPRSILLLYKNKGRLSWRPHAGWRHRGRRWHNKFRFFGTGVLFPPEWSDFYLPTVSRLRRLWNRPQPKVLCLHHRIFWYLAVTESAACSRHDGSNAHEDFREISGESLALRETWLRRHRLRHQMRMARHRDRMALSGAQNGARQQPGSGAWTQHVDHETPQRCLVFQPLRNARSSLGRRRAVTIARIASTTPNGHAPCRKP
jgi:hypothetical protein